MMTRHAHIFAALIAGLALMAPAQASDATELASDNCFQVGQRLASNQGATLVGAEAAQQNGAAGCRIVLLFEAQGEERPRREEIFVAE